MRQVKLEPAQALLASLSREELLRLGKQARIRIPDEWAKSRAVDELARHLALDELVAMLGRLFPKRRPAGSAPRRGDEPRLDRVLRMHGETTVQVYGKSDPGLGRLLLAHDGRCLVLRLDNVQLFLDNRWPVAARTGGWLPGDRLFAAFVRRARVHPQAGAPPGKDRPFVLDQGEYGLRNGRFRLELARSGLLSFAVRFLGFRRIGAARAARPEYLLRPIA